MGENLTISEHIYNNTLFGDKCEFSGFGALTEFFSAVPEDVQKQWPFDFSDKGYRTSYEQALIVSEQMGFVRRLHLRAQIANAEESFFVSRKIWFDDGRLIFVHDSLCREKGAGGTNFAGLLMTRTQDFLRSYDKTRKIRYKNEHSEILVQARSIPKGKMPVFGGYIWANQGFDFQNKSDLPRFRSIFKQFLAGYGVSMDAGDLKKFTKPCHFAAFGCGIGARDGEGRPVHLGKAFLLEQTWFGRWSTDKPDAEEKRYARLYNRPDILPSSRRRTAIAALGESYRKLLHKYYKRYAPKRRSVSKMEVYRRFAQRQWNHLINGGRN